MKKILSLMILFFSCFSLVKAEELTFDVVVSKMKESEMYKTLNTDEVSTEITSTNDKMTITYDASESGVWVTEFTFANDIISYQFTGDKNAETTFSQSLMDGIWITEIFNIIAYANGYTDEQLNFLEEEKSSTYTLEKNGIQMTYFEHSHEGNSTGATVSLSGSGCDTFKININSLNLEIEENSEVVDTNTSTNNSIIIDESNKDETKESEVNSYIDQTIESPQTGSLTPLFSCLIFFIGGILLYIRLNRNRKLKRL